MIVLSPLYYDAPKYAANFLQFVSLPSQSTILFFVIWANI